MTEPKKDTIYIDVDDEITGIIEKVRSSPQKIVALVLPKRAAVFQSIVNVKLLKHSADKAKKKLVLITSETGLLPLAGAVGLHVAKTLQSKPALPPVPPSPDESAAPAINVPSTDSNLPLDASKPVGELSGMPEPDGEETIDLEDDNPDSAAPAAVKKSKKTDKKLKVPNFNKFRVRLALAGALLLALIIVWFVAARVMPRANVAIKTDTQTISANMKFVSSPHATALDEETSVVPATTKNLKKNEGQKAPATGQKNVGQKATGTVRLINCSQADKLSDTNRTVPAGTAITAGGIAFILDEAVEVEPSSFIGNACQKNKKSSAKAVTAQNPGETYNVQAKTYQVAGFASITGEGSEMSGGTDSLVKVVSQQDIDSLTQRITEAFTASAKDDLAKQLQAEGLVPLVDTFSVGEPVTVSSPNVGDEAGEVTANVTMDFAMQGVSQEDIKKLIDNEVSDDIDTERQVILDYGLEQSVFQINERQPDGNVSYSLQTIVVAGPEIDEEILKREIAGKKSGEAENIIRNYPGVKEVSVDLSPFWVVKTPGNLTKITITIETVNQTQNAEDQ